MDDTDARLDTMYRMRQSGMSLEGIGSHFDTSKQAVAALLVKHYGSSKVTELLTTANLARLTGFDRGYILKLKLRGVIQPVKSGQVNQYWKPETIATIIIYRDRNPPICRMCQGPLPPGRQVFCSLACSTEGGKFKNRPPEVKERQRERMQRWERDHPDLAREIHRRAEGKYKEKRRAKRLTEG